ncbi:MAG: S9 family peptidase [Bacteroidales bacterium]|nr:S9 family peptidase [Bacteroidales bacterium]
MTVNRLSRTSYPLFIILFLLFLAGTTFGQETKPITLEDAFQSRKFSSAGLYGLRSMNDGLHYTVREGEHIEKFSYKTGELVETLFDAAEFGELTSISGYHFNDSETKILIETGVESIYRHSYLASNFVYDMESATLVPVSGRGKQQLGTFSPDGSYVAFVRENNLYVRDLSQDEEKQVTFDGVRNEIINGAPDWVYEEEFGFSQGFHWSPDGKKIAFYRFDERRVQEFHMTMFGPLYPESYKFKYPKAGEMNSLVTIHVFDLESGLTIPIDVGEETDQYIPRIKWTRDPEVLSIMRLNRLQNQLDILHAGAADGQSQVVYSETNLYYIFEASDNTITYLPDGESFILSSEKDAYFHLYHYNFVSGDMQAITSGDYDIASFMGYDEKQQRLYYSSYEESSIQRHLYSIKLDGTKKQKLSTQPGTNRASFSSSFKYYILTHSSANTPPYITLHNQKGKLIRVLEDNEKMKKTAKEYGYALTGFLTVPTASGEQLNAWMIKPNDFDPNKEYPLFIYVYGGPESQNVTDSWGRRGAWFQMLVQQGYVVACVDNRGTNGRGEAFRKATYMKLGELETIDQIEAAQWFGSQDYIDEERIGMFGWSYGGYMTSLCMTKGEGTFKMGIAVAPVTNWRYYDTVYTERFMRTPQENPEGYDDNSPINFVDGLQGKFLLVHGSGDDNVHYQNSMDFVEALVQANKQFEMQFYPNKNHGIYGGNTSIHLYTRMTEFILKNL